MEKQLPITISATALEKILEIRSQKGITDDYCLRLGVKAAGCGIASYVIGFDHINDKDEVYLLDGLKIIIEKIQVMYLAGKVVAYGNAEGKLGFIFRDKN